MANMSEKIREVRLIWPCGQKDRRRCSEENMEVDDHRKIGRPTLRWSDVIRRHEGESSKDRRNTRPEDVEIENNTK